jgi:hypothetical protein
VSGAGLLLAWGLIGLGSGAGIVRIWKRAPRVWNEPQPWWIWGEQAWRVYRRSLVVLLGIWGVLGLALAAGFAGFPRAVIVAALLVAFVVGPLLILTIGLFNEPKRLVPPGFRSEPGLLGRRRVRRPQRRS